MPPHATTTRPPPPRALAMPLPHLLMEALDAMTSHIALLDGTGRIVYVNRAWREFGARNGLQDPGWSLDRDYLEVCRAAADVDPDAAKAAAALSSLLEGRRITTTFEYPCHSPTKPRWFIFRGARFDVDDTTYLVVSHDDITKRHLAEERLQDSHHALETFNLVVSHDLRAPLRRIEDLSRIAQAEEGPDTVTRELLARIEAETGRARALAKDMLELSRVGALDPQPSTVDVTALAQDLANVLNAADSDRRVTWRIQPDLVAEADPRILRVVLSNLLLNAWKFTRDRSHPVIELGAHGDAFYVKDNGIGIAAKDAERIFRPFTRAAAARSYEGTGMGLALVQRAVERMRGRVWATGQPGKGATFWFTIRQA